MNKSLHKKTSEIKTKNTFNKINVYNKKSNPVLKRILAFLLIISFVSICFVGCGSSDDSKASSGSVYWLNFKPEADAVLNVAAAKYKEQTGISVKIVTPESGSYNETLEKEFQKIEDAKKEAESKIDSANNSSESSSKTASETKDNSDESSSEAESDSEAEESKLDVPTLFVLNNQESVNKWSDYCYDLSNTKVAKELNTDAYNMYTSDGKLAAIGYCYECFGIIVNKDLLKQAGYSIKDITNFESLKTVADSIHQNSKSLGFDAFTSSAMDSSSSWRFSGHLANVPLFYESRDDGGWTECPSSIKGTYLDNYKNLWDLYTTDTYAEKSTLAEGGYNAAEEFASGQAVFYQNGSWEYEGLIEMGMDPDSMQMIPLYCGVEGEEKAGLNCGTENCWAVNAKADEADIKATLDFMKWLVSDGSSEVVSSLGIMPYKHCADSENIFLTQANKYANSGCYTMTWVFNMAPNTDVFRANLVTALNAYDSGESWSLVKKAFVETWKEQYDILHPKEEPTTATPETTPETETEAETEPLDEEDRE